MKIIDYFRDLGFDEDKVRLYLNRHDEPILEIEEEFFKEHYDFFNDVCWVSAQGWKPFKIDWMVSHSYGTPIEEYTDMVNRVKECPDPTIEDTPQFLPLELPRIMSFQKKELIDDRVIFLLSEFVGDFPEDGFNFGKFKDKRDIVFDLQLSKLNGDSLDEQQLLNIVNNFLKPLDNHTPFLVYIEGQEKLTHITMGDKDVWVTGEPNDLTVINNCIIASAVNHLDPSLVDENMDYWLKLSDRLKGRMRRRGEENT